MARPIKQRRVCELPPTAVFSPEKEGGNSETVELAIDEYEVIRLIDYLGFTQNECAQQMNVARTTVQAIYDSARKKISDALVNSKRLAIRGGNYILCSYSNKCCGKNCKNRHCESGKCDQGNYQCSNCSCTKV